jgi:hypothetical protein
MPIIFHSTKNLVLNRSGRGGRFDAAVRELAPFIVELQSAGYRDIRKLAKQLDAVGLRAPSGEPFSYGTLWRILNRMAKLGLGLGPRTMTEVARQPRPWVRPYGERCRIGRNVVNRIQSAENTPGRRLNANPHPDNIRSDALDGRALEKAANSQLRSELSEDCLRHGFRQTSKS